jgi:predicted dehydrogenase
MQAILDTGATEIAAIADPSTEMADEALRLAPQAKRVSSLDEMLDAGVDGVVIATPNALHAEQSIRALQRGAAVFCQKPLGRTAAEVSSVVRIAREADRLLAVDLSYRFLVGMRRVRGIVRSGELGRVFMADVVFHNAYGPDKPWFYDRALSGGGCVMDLGVHLVDLALWVLDFPGIGGVRADLFAGGEPVRGPIDRVEDFAVATIELESGAVVRLACSWRLHAGREAIISAAFYGTGGSVSVHNVDGSFYDFIAERHRGTAHEILAAPPDAWGGRAAADWAARLSHGELFSPDAERLTDVALVLDRIYGR